MVGYAALAASAAPYVSAGLDFVGGLMGNSSSAKEAGKNRAWQEYMSNTAHVREVRDLKRAGLNPMLSGMGGSGASSPGGATAQQSNPFSSGASKLATAGITNAQVENLAAATDKTKAETRNTEVSTAKTLAEIPNIEKTGKLTDAQAYKISYEIPQILRQGNLTDAQTRNLGASLENLLLTPNLTRAQIQSELARAGLTTAQINEVGPRIENLRANTRSTNAGVGYKEFTSLPGDLLDQVFGNSAKDVSRSTTSRAVGTIKNKALELGHEAPDFFNRLTDDMRRRRRESDKTRNR